MEEEVKNRELTENAGQENAQAEKNQKKSGKKEKEKLTGWPRVRKEIREWILSLGVAVGAVYLIACYLFLPIKVDGNSMYPTLKSGERLFVSVLDVKLFDKIERGDVVICHYPGRTSEDPFLGLVTMQTNFVKRVVGIPGDTVSRKLGITFINGEPLDGRSQNLMRCTIEDGKYYINGREKALTLEETRSYEFDYEYVLGEDEYFVVGDNRYNSHDSRKWNGPEVERVYENNVRGDVGPITKDMIVGRAKFVFWPLSSARKVENDPYYAYPGDPVPTGNTNADGGSNESNE